MPAEIGQRHRPAVCCQIGRACTEYAPHLAHPQHVQRAVGQIGDAHRYVHAFVDQAHHPVQQ